MTDETATAQPQPGRLVSAAVRAIWVLGMLLVGAFAVCSLYSLGIYAKDVVSGISATRVVWVGVALLVAGVVWGLVIWDRGP